MDQAVQHNGDHLEVTTGRLRLVALDPELARLEETDRPPFSRRSAPSLNRPGRRSRSMRRTSPAALRR